MKLGVVLSLFEKNWQELFELLRSQGLDHYEVLPENESIFSIKDLQTFVGDTEVIFHAPFTEDNFISPHLPFRQAAQSYFKERLTPLVKAFDPKVITTHVGATNKIFPEIHLEELRQILNDFPACALENMPGGSHWLSGTYPATEAECDFVLDTLSAKMTYDVGHVMKQGLDVYALLEKYFDRIVDVHIHDIIDGTDHQVLGTGSFDTERFMSVLKKRKYQGYVSIELHHNNVSGMIESLKVLRQYA